MSEATGIRTRKTAPTHCEPCALAADQPDPPTPRSDKKRATPSFELLYRVDTRDLNESYGPSPVTIHDLHPIGPKNDPGAQKQQ